jgi:hypothetical protein
MVPSKKDTDLVLCLSDLIANEPGRKMLNSVTKKVTEENKLRIHGGLRKPLTGLE